MTSPLPDPGGALPPARPDEHAAPAVLARATSARGELVLRAHPTVDGPAVLELRANGIFVMDTRETTTERAMAAAALAEHPHPERVLVGGLGLGFTLAEVLADPRVRSCTVVEIEPDLVGWMRDGTVPHGPPLMSDPRVEAVTGDVAEVLAGAARASYDLVLLDVDNGPAHLVHDANAGLYRPPFLTTLRELLAPGGALVVWSAAEAPGLRTALTQVFGEATAAAHSVRLGARDEQYWLYAARVPSPT